MYLKERVFSTERICLLDGSCQLCSADLYRLLIFSLLNFLVSEMYESFLLFGGKISPLSSLTLFLKFKFCNIFFSFKNTHVIVSRFWNLVSLPGIICLQLPQEPHFLLLHSLCYTPLNTRTYSS